MAAGPGSAISGRLKMRVLFIDDHQLVREALIYYFTSLQPDVEVVEAGSVSEVIASKPKGRFDLVLLDYQLPGLTGNEAIIATCSHFPEAAIVVLSGAITRHQASAALAHGATGVISKTIEGEHLVRILRRILQGDANNTIAGFGVSIARSEPTTEPATRFEALLTRRERQVAQLLVSGYANKEIAAALRLADITVRLHLRSLYSKLGARSRTDAVRVILQHERNAP